MRIDSVSEIKKNRSKLLIFPETTVNVAENIIITHNQFDSYFISKKHKCIIYFAINSQ